MTHLGPTPTLDLDHPRLRELMERRGWAVLEPRARIGAVYDFVRNEVPFDYNVSDLLPASWVLDDGHGQCSTKATLLMALLRATGTECRFHGATIHKKLQKGVVTGLSYVLAPGEILHSWAEARFEDRWVGLGSVILDSGYLRGLRRSVRSEEEVLGYGAGAENIADPPVVWCGMETTIQKAGIARDLRIFDDPDSFYQVHGEDLPGFRGLLYKHVIRHRTNRRVAHVRNTGARLWRPRDWLFKPLDPIPQGSFPRSPGIVPPRSVAICAQHWSTFRAGGVRDHAAGKAPQKPPPRPG